MERVIYRPPPYILGSQIFMYNEVQDQQPWSLVNQKIEPIWADTKGKGVTVAVLDTGLWKHRDLPDPTFAANFSSSASVYDKQGHGTHVAGTIGARLDGAGVVGYAPECNLGAVKVLGDDGTGDSQSIARGIRYAADHGADIINMSLGGGFDPLIAQACKDVIQQGVFIICAAGNDGQRGGQNTVGWPARLPDTLAIASYNKDGRISDFSSRGPEVDAAFPGEDILSTWPNDAFRRISGTSMATPAACGLTALMLSYSRAHPEVRPVRNNSELLTLWRDHAQDMGDPGKDTSFGWGIPDAAGVVRGSLLAPPPPVVVAPPPPVPTVPGTPGDLTPIGPPFGMFELLNMVPAAWGTKKGLFIYVDK